MASMLQGTGTNPVNPVQVTRRDPLDRPRVDSSVAFRKFREYMTRLDELAVGSSESFRNGRWDYAVQRYSENEYLVFGTSSRGVDNYNEFHLKDKDQMIRRITSWVENDMRDLLENRNNNDPEQF